MSMQAIQRLAATHSVEAMVLHSPAGRFLDPQVIVGMCPSMQYTLRLRTLGMHGFL